MLKAILKLLASGSRSNTLSLLVNKGIINGINKVLENCVTFYNFKFSGDEEKETPLNRDIKSKNSLEKPGIRTTVSFDVRTVEKQVERRMVQYNYNKGTMISGTQEFQNTNENWEQFGSKLLDCISILVERGGDVIPLIQRQCSQKPNNINNAHGNHMKLFTTLCTSTNVDAIRQLLSWNINGTFLSKLIDNARYDEFVYLVHNFKLAQWLESKDINDKSMYYNGKFLHKFDSNRGLVETKSLIGQISRTFRDVTSSSDNDDEKCAASKDYIDIDANKRTKMHLFLAFFVAQADNNLLHQVGDINVSTSHFIAPQRILECKLGIKQFIGVLCSNIDFIESNLDPNVKGELCEFFKDVKQLQLQTKHKNKWYSSDIFDKNQIETLIKKIEKKQ